MKVKAKVDLFCGGYRRRAGTVFEIDGSPTKHMEVLQAAVATARQAARPAACPHRAAAQAGVLVLVVLVVGPH